MSSELQRLEGPETRRFLEDAMFAYDLSGDGPLPDGFDALKPTGVPKIFVEQVDGDEKRRTATSFAAVRLFADNGKPVGFVDTVPVEAQTGSVPEILAVIDIVTDPDSEDSQVADRLLSGVKSPLVGLKVTKAYVSTTPIVPSVNPDHAIDYGLAVTSNGFLKTKRINETDGSVEYDGFAVFDVGALNRKTDERIPTHAVIVAGSPLHPEDLSPAQLRYVRAQNEAARQARQVRAEAYRRENDNQTSSQE